MSARSADCEDFVALSSNDHGLLSHMSANHPTVRYVVEWNSFFEIRSRRRGLLGAHLLDPLLIVRPVSLAEFTEYVNQVFDLLHKVDLMPTFIRCTGTPSSF